MSGFTEHLEQLQTVRAPVVKLCWAPLGTSIWLPVRRWITCSQESAHPVRLAHHAPAPGLRARGSRLTGVKTTCFQSQSPQIMNHTYDNAVPPPAQVKREDLVAELRAQCKGTQHNSSSHRAQAPPSSRFRGVTRHAKGKWEARISQAVGRRYKCVRGGGVGGLRRQC